MTNDRVRRQILRAIGGLVLAPVSACLSADVHGTQSQPVLHDLLAALEEGALLQIDWNDMRDVLTAMGDAPPVCSVLICPDVGAVVKQCGDVLAQHVGRLNAAVVVVSGNRRLNLAHCRVVLSAVADATVTSTKASEFNATRTARNRLQSRLNAPPMVLHGVVVDAAISDGLRVTVLAG